MTTEPSAKKTFESEGWVDVHPGMLSVCAQRKRRRTRWRQATAVAGLVAIFAVGIGFGLTASDYWSRPSEMNFGGITCREVQELLPKVAAMEELPAEQLAKVHAHVAQCPHCQRMREKMKMMYQERISAVQRASGPQQATAALNMNVFASL